MTAALVTTEVSADQIALIKKTVASGATDAELELYLHDCKRHGVHPLDKLLHFTKRGGRYVPVTSIDLFRSRAGDSGEHAGTDDAVYTGDPGKAGFAATVTVWRVVRGIRSPFTATARWSEYYPGEGGVGAMWRKMPHTLLAKCAEALALRKGFPAILAGLYAREELDQAGEPEASAEQPKPVKAAVVKPAALPAGPPTAAPMPADMPSGLPAGVWDDTGAMSAYALRKGWDWPRLVRDINERYSVNYGITRTSWREVQPEHREQAIRALAALPDVPGPVDPVGTIQAWQRARDLAQQIAARDGGTAKDVLCKLAVAARWPAIGDFGDLSADQLKAAEVAFRAKLGK
jgi:hypothetical protein